VGRELKRLLFRGSEAFTEAMRAKVPRGRDYRKVPQARPRPTAKPIRDYAREHADRDFAIAAAYESCGYTMRDIGDYFGLHYYSRVSKIVGKSEMAKGKT